VAYVYSVNAGEKFGLVSILSSVDSCARAFDCVCGRSTLQI